MFLGQFASLPVALLGAAAGISLFTGGLADALVIAGVVVLNATIGYVTESQTEQTIHSLKHLVRPSALVQREGRVETVRAEDIVPGDVLVLHPGSYIAADARLVETQRLSVDESVLTGESLPVPKTSAVLVDAETPLADRHNMVYGGTLVTGGQGLAIVVATGRYTEMGRIQALVEDAESPETPLQRQLNALGRQLVWISSAVCGLVFGIGLLQGYGVLEMLTIAVSLAVAAVPEGLPTVATTVLALGIRTMRRHKVLIRRLEAVETLGAVQTICLDKTGTLTLNRMTVVSLYAGQQEVQVTHEAFLADGMHIEPLACAEMTRLLQVGALCSEVELVSEHDTYVLHGSPTENALVHLAITSGVDVAHLRQEHPLLHTQHRAENHNFMSTLHRTPCQQHLLAVKGSPGEVLSMCAWIMQQGRLEPLTAATRRVVESANTRMAGASLRVLGMAYREWDGNDEPVAQHCDLVWLGLTGMADPVRPGVSEVIGDFHRAGIDTVMITGDQSPTAYAIGKDLGLNRNGALETLDSTHLSNIEPEVMTALASRVHVFARVSPAHKLQIVQALQRAGKVVAMTGDGINDGPALKAADIGIAMGHTGTDVAREVADVVLENDELETMVIAISEGRTIYNNIRKSVRFLLATNLSEIMVMFVALASGLGQPLNAMQLLWINLLSDIAPGLALAMEAPEPDVLQQPPRDPEEPILTATALKRIATEGAVLSAGTLGAYGYGLLRYGAGAQANTLAFSSLTIGQLLHTLSCRSETHSAFDPAQPANPYITLALAGSLGLQVLAFVVPGLRTLLGLTPLTLLDSAVIAAAAVGPLLLNESMKPYWQRQVAAHSHAPTLAPSL
jgi:Ca2+-transporting ATPase